MARKKRKMILIISIISVVLVISAIIASVLYFNTDVFKSKSELFVKYMMKNIENANDITSNINADEFNIKTQESKYISNTNIKFSCIENVSEATEDTSNSINNFNVSINGNIDKSNNYNYQDIKLLNNNEEKMQVEYVRDNNTFGVKFPELFQQHILLENSNLKDIFENMGYEDVSKIPDSIEINDDIFSYISFSNEEMQQLENKYTKILQGQIADQSLTSSLNQIITVGEHQVKAKSYTLTLTKEQMNNIFLKVLEEIKQDDILLNKLSNIDDLTNIYSSITKNENSEELKTKFVDDIDDLIRKINASNIGNDETSITVYESNKNTIKTVIKYIDYEISLDILNIDKNQYIKLNIQNNKVSKTKTIVFQKNNENTILEISNNVDGTISKTTIDRNASINGNKGTRNLSYIYEDNSNKIEAVAEENIEFVNDFDKVNIEENNIKLNELEQDKLKNVTNQIQTAISNKVKSIFTDENKQDLNKILQVIGIAKQQRTIESEGISEVEKSRFNSKFELLQGEELDAERIIDLIEEAKGNMVDLEVVSNTQLKIQLDKNNGNSEVATRLTDFVKNEENSRYSYDVSLEYDNDTGLVKYIVLNIITE